MGRIIVGVDGSAPSIRALRWASEEAQVRGAVVHAVYAYKPLAGVRGRAPATHALARSGAEPAGGGGLEAEALAPAVATVESAQREADARLATAVGLLVGMPAPVETEAVASDRPAEVLIQRSRHAELLVVGSRGRGGMAGLLLGSVSQQCILHAHCPVVMLR
jgi:nucleotide-binding universal stress UspA family protein